MVTTVTAPPPQSFLRSRALFWFLPMALFIAILWMARATALTFPVPNEDEATFFLPSWNLAVHGSWNPEILNAPNGIYWIPHGYYIWLALFLRIFGPTIEVARTVGQITTAAAAVILFLALKRICGSIFFGGMCALLLVSPSVILAANEIRMESLIFLFYAVAILLHSYRRYLHASAVLILSVLVHPALLVSAALYLIAAIGLCYTQRHNVRWFSPLNGIVILAVLVAIGAEATLIVHHMELFRQHMALQVHRKTQLGLISLLLQRRGLFLLAETIILMTLFLTAHRAQVMGKFLVKLVPVALIALGLQTYSAFGNEMPYTIYSYALVPATLFSVAYATTLLVTRKP
jgi:hypothetical protein